MQYLCEGGRNLLQRQFDHLLGSKRQGRPAAAEGMQLGYILPSDTILLLLVVHIFI